MKNKILLFIFIFTYFQIQSLFAQNWEWETRPDLFCELNNIFPITKDKWIMEGRTRSSSAFFNSQFGTESYFVMVDSTGTLWGEILNSHHIIDIQSFNDNFLFIAIGNLDSDKIRNVLVYEIVDEKPISLSSTFNLQNLLMYAGDDFSVSPDLNVSVVSHFEDTNQMNGARIKINGQQDFYTLFDSKINDFISLGNKEFILSGNIEEQTENFGIVKIIGTVDSNFIFQQKALKDKIIEKIILLENGNLIAASSNFIYQLNEEFEVISSFDFTTLGEFENILLDGNSIHLVTQQITDQVSIHEFNLQLELMNTIPIKISNADLRTVRIKDGVIGIGANLFFREIENNEQPPSSMFLKVFNKNKPPKFKGTDVSIEKIRIPTFEVEKDELCNIDLYNVNLKNVKLTIKNKGQQTIDELYVNFKFDKNIYGYPDCNGTTFQNVVIINKDYSEKFFHLNLAPGESTEIFITDLPVNRISPDQFQNLDLIPLCFYISSIEHSLDVDPSNNYACESILLQHETISPPIDEKNPFVLFPNPTNERIRVRILQAENQFSNIWISNTLGQQVTAPTNFEDNLLIEFDVQDLPNGIYFINFDDGENLYSEKFIKQ